MFALPFFQATPVFAQNPSGISDHAMQQIVDMLAMKATFNDGEKKMSSNLIFANRAARGMDIRSMTGLVATNRMHGGVVEVEIKATVSEKLLKQITAQGGEVTSHSAARILGRLPLRALHVIAEDASVQSIREPSLIGHNVGSVLTQGYISHRVGSVSGGINGSGVKVGVLADSASNLGSVPALIASGDLGPNTTVLADLPSGGLIPGKDEGAAMMEVIQDIAPKAQLFFATGEEGESSMASNIALLAAAGCSIIVDDVFYFTEPVFQDGVIAQAIDSFVAGGGLYITSAGNNGNLDSGTSGTWEGDFLDGGPIGFPLDGTIGIAKPSSVFHNFGTAGKPQLFNTLIAAGQSITLQWAEPQGASGSDYDLFVLDSTGNSVLGSSTDVQTGTQNPFEIITPSASMTAGSQVVITRASGSACALHLSCLGGGGLATATTGGISGHSACGNAISVAAIYWNVGQTGVHPFSGVSNVVENFSSDGPRIIFFNTNGTAISPGNLEFSTGGGTTILKPDVTAADGVTTHEFSPYFGTSAAAAHVAGIAALVKSANPGLTAAQIRQILNSTAIDIMAPGFDRDSGNGIVNAPAAVQATGH